MNLGDIFDQRDLKQLKAYGISPEAALVQLERFKTGFPYLKLIRPCKLKDGLSGLVANKFEDYRQVFRRSCESGRVSKFVPASGAASRMFQELSKGKAGVQKEFIANLPRFAFYEDLKKSLLAKGKKIEHLIAQNKTSEIISHLLCQEGMGYFDLPKGLVLFHKYSNGARTAFEEHLTEAAAYAADQDGCARIHFTIAGDYQKLIKEKIDCAVSNFSNPEIKFEVTYSIQKKSTDTIAADIENKPFRTKEGELVFWPGGHGALIENLNDLKGDIVFIKNIDNVVPDRLKATTHKYKEILGGYLVILQDQIFYYLRQLEQQKVEELLFQNAFNFIENYLSLQPKINFKEASEEQRKEYLFSVLNRPLRVCGMVPNQGEPGGGPFWTESSGHRNSLQIVESAQVDLSNEEQKAIWKASTHFNPVDLVCGLLNYRGESFKLDEFVDSSLGFIANKSKEGRELRSLELPGLWNGAMANWNTVFVEVPIETFNPVKTVMDLLRPQHQEINHG